MWLLVVYSLIWSRGDFIDHCLKYPIVLACEDELGLNMLMYKNQGRY